VKAAVERCAPARLIYRLCDFSAEDFGFLDPRERSGSTERGAQFLIDETSLLKFDLAVIDALLDSGVDVRVLIPFIRFPDHWAACATGSRVSSRPDRIRPAA